MNQKGQIIAVILLLSLAAYLSFNFFRQNRARAPQVYFYDESAGKLFTAPQNAVPPIAGVDGPGADGMRALVFSPTGDCGKDQQIAYLEKYSAELKGQFEAAQARPGEDLPRMSRGAAQGHTFVRRVKEANWHTMDSEEGGRIVGEWRTENAGRDPVICVP